jgi:hypothetical protein
MDGATQTRRAGPVWCFLAGLQAGMLGIFAMLAWLGISAAWQQRSFWTTENLMASLFYGYRAIHSGFAGSTVSGLAVYLALYSLLGGLLAYVLRDRLARIRILLLSVLFALVWYYLSYRVLWRAAAPLVSLLHVERATILGHLVYGTILARYPLYLPRPHSETPAPPAPPEAPPAPEAPPPPPAEVPGEPTVGSESA